SHSIPSIRLSPETAATVPRTRPSGREVEEAEAARVRASSSQPPPRSPSTATISRPSRGGEGGRGAGGRRRGAGGGAVGRVARRRRDLDFRGSYPRFVHGPREYDRQPDRRGRRDPWAHGRPGRERDGSDRVRKQ